jgi:hypothetical protein
LFLREMQHGLGLQDADERAAQVEDQIAFGISLLRDADGRALLGDFIAKPAFVAVLEQITDAR